MLCPPKALMSKPQLEGRPPPTVSGKQSLSTVSVSPPLLMTTTSLRSFEARSARQEPASSQLQASNARLDVVPAGRNTSGLVMRLRSATPERGQRLNPARSCPLPSEANAASVNGEPSQAAL